MNYKPSFTCKYCNEPMNVQTNGNQGVVELCGCKESREAWEKEHRAEMERRKRLRRGY